VSPVRHSWAFDRPSVFFALLLALSVGMAGGIHAACRSHPADPARRRSAGAPQKSREHRCFVFLPSASSAPIHASERSGVSGGSLRHGGRSPFVHRAHELAESRQTQIPLLKPMRMGAKGPGRPVPPETPARSDAWTQVKPACLSSWSSSKDPPDPPGDPHKDPARHAASCPGTWAAPGARARP
jgi:hypothetical protein